MNNKISFGDYFDDQRDRIVNDMQTAKNAELYIAWRKDYDERQNTKMKNRRKTIKQQRKDMLKKYEGKLEGPYDHLKEGVDYLDDIQRMKQ